MLSLYQRELATVVDNESTIIHSDNDFIITVAIKQKQFNSVPAKVQMEALRDRVAVVTGASEGIGEGIVRRLAAEGMKVAALARRIDRLTELENDLKGKGYIVKGYICDVQKEDDVKAAFKSIEEDFGAITLLVNNAGVNKPISLDGHRDLPFDTISVYTASKKAITSLCTSLRNHLKSSKIRVTSISPHLVKTMMTKSFLEKAPNLSCLLPSDVAEAVVYAVSAPLNVNADMILCTMLSLYQRELASIVDNESKIIHSDNYLIITVTIKLKQLKLVPVEVQMEALRERVAVVTGASEGIGEAIVRRLAAEGMKVAALARRIDRLTELENELKGKGYIVKGYICDVQSESDVKAAFKSIEEDFGAITLLVNNAGVSKAISLDDINLDNVNTVLNTNVVGVLSCTKEGLASMKKHSVDRAHVSISPGLVRTMMTQSYLDRTPDIPHLLPSDVAEAVVYAISAPLNVNCNWVAAIEQMEALRDRVAVVTGGSEGIGEAIVRRLACQGMKVAALARRMNNLKALENDMKEKGYTVKGYICDVKNESDVKAAFKSIEEDFGTITILINNAGAYKAVSLDDIHLDDVNTVLNTNVQGVLACVKEGLALMKKHSVDRGHIVVINSVAGHRDIPHQAVGVYSASKKAVTSLCTTLRNHLKSSKIRVTSISPGLVKTTMSKPILDKTPDIPHLLPCDVADAVIYALSAPLRVNVSDVILDYTES
ncbi:unnamed protein product [Nezara viridula]|uniref:Uncharacterized protein n=1 Tax=Nezara viridula TaxID=85310 RepID=A0A9P0HNA0_NEZVI|nr:unnamed protein product [Nezara viridula]